ncbi:MAG: hypothetical protein HYR80_08995, partial [Nitrospirae bacterium]|nr:hypothetical protein [Nitrospirota bacterium]
MTKHLKTLVFFLFQLLLINSALFSTSSIASSTEIGNSTKVVQNIPRPNFNHDSTTFQLLGAHRGLECNKCHLAGRYKGTPRNCSDCHNGQITYGKPADHIMTTQACTLCHSQNSWLPTTFTHDASSAGQCSTCHNGQKATGKSANHISTNSQCDTCHRTSAWIPAGFNHANLGNQLCSSCHKAGGTGMAPTSDAVHSNLGGQDCKSCHASTTTFTTLTMNHTGIVAPCSTCHATGNTVGAMVKPSNHMATTQECSSCHAGTSTFANGIFNHSGLTGQLCSSCHKSGGTGMAPKSDVVHSNLGGQDCKSCHSGTVTFTGSTMNHAGIVIPCSTCHIAANAVGAMVKPSNHMVTTQECNLCHAGTSTFANGIFNHSGLTGQLCSSCHKSGGSGMAPKSDVVHSNLGGQDCSSCHTGTVTFTGSTMNHAGIVAACSTCHYVGNSVGAVAKSSNHMTTTQECNLCHAGTSTFANGIFNHSSLTGQLCSSCHKSGGSGMAPKSDVVHSNLGGQDCSSCHASTTTFTTATMNHAGVVAACSTCHYVGNSVGAVAKSSNHMATTQECNLCHAGTTTFANGVFNHSTLTGQLCNSCHKTGGSGMAPKNDVVHSNLAGQDCKSCHASTTTFTTATMNHTGIVAVCSTCHSVGNAVGAVAKPSNHMVTTQECNLCHAGTATFANGIFNHSTLTGQLCNSCHKTGGS